MKDFCEPKFWLLCPQKVVRCVHRLGMLCPQNASIVSTDWVCCVHRMRLLCPQMNILKKDPMLNENSLLADILMGVLDLCDHFHLKNNRSRAISIKRYVFGENIQNLLPLHLLRTITKKFSDNFMSLYIGRNTDLMNRLNDHLKKLTGLDKDYFSRLSQNDLLDLKTVLADINNLLTLNPNLCIRNMKRG